MTLDVDLHHPRRSSAAISSSTPPITLTSLPLKLSSMLRLFKLASESKICHWRSASVFDCKALTALQFYRRSANSDLNIQTIGCSGTLQYWCSRHATDGRHYRR